MTSHAPMDCYFCERSTNQRYGCWGDWYPVCTDCHSQPCDLCGTPVGEHYEIESLSTISSVSATEPSVRGSSTRTPTSGTHGMLTYNAGTSSGSSRTPIVPHFTSSSGAHGALVTPPPYETSVQVDQNDGSTRLLFSSNRADVLEECRNIEEGIRNIEAIVRNLQPAPDELAFPPGRPSAGAAAAFGGYNGQAAIGAGVANAQSSTAALRLTQDALEINASRQQEEQQFGNVNGFAPNSRNHAAGRQALNVRPNGGQVSSRSSQQSAEDRLAVNSRHAAGASPAPSTQDTADTRSDAGRGAIAMPTEAQILACLRQATRPMTVREVYLRSLGRDPVREEMGAGVKGNMNRILSALKGRRLVTSANGLWSLTGSA